LIRLAAALLALAWIAAPVAAVFHGIAEAHHYCAEHRSFEETQGSETGGGRTDQRREDEPGSLPTDGDRNHHGCAFQTAWLSDQTLRGPDLLGSPVPEGAVPVAPLVVGVCLVVDILASAPKTSPPDLAS
jgi:hypothetical protein